MRFSNELIKLAKVYNHRHGLSVDTLISMGMNRKARRYFETKQAKSKVTAASIVTAGTLVATQTVGATAAHAANGTYEVSNCNDTGSGSLRQALQDASNFNDPSQITFSPALGCSTINVQSDLPHTREDLTIVGPGADKLNVEFGGTTSRGLYFTRDVANVAVSGLELTHFGISLEPTPTLQATVIDGVDFENVGGNLGWERPIFSGSYNAESTTVVTNSTIGHSGTVSGTTSDWGILAGGALAVDNTTIVGNVFQEGVLAAGVSVWISNSTIVGNTFDAGNFQIPTFNSGQYMPNYSSDPSTLRLFGNLFARNVLSGSNACQTDSTTDVGANLFDVPYTACTTAPLPTVAQSNGGSAVLAGLGTTVANTLSANGGSTPTLALLDGSPAIDYYSNGDSGITYQPASLDQRGLSRPYGSGYDVGAFEYRPLALPSTTPKCKPVVLTPVNFKRDSAVLTKSAQKKLRVTASAIAKSGCHTVTLNGYSAAPDKSTATATKYRLKLASARAASVKAYLTTALKALHVSVTFKVNALGAKHPVASNKTETGQKQNRRVSIAVSKLRATL